MRNPGWYGPRKLSTARRAAQWVFGPPGGQRSASPATPVEWGRVRRVAVLRLDHLGDLLMAFPALAALRKALPAADIELFVGPWGAELAHLCPSVDAVRVVDVPWFHRPARPLNFPGILELAWGLRRGRYDLGVELRGDIRQLVALRLSGIGQRLGHTLTYGRGTLTSAGTWALRHEVDQNLALLRHGGLPGVPTEGTAVPRLALPKGERIKARAYLGAQRLKRGFLALHPSAGGASRLWPDGHWVELLKGLPAGRGLALLGTEEERARLEALRRDSGRSDARVLAGGTSVAALAAVLEQAGALIGLNSGPGHLAAAVGTPVLSLFSGANDPARWAPRGRRVKVLNVAVPCSPCELSVCPYDNACMRAVAPALVLGELRRLLRGLA